MSLVNNKLIAKNTLLLYIRMFLIMGVSLYTVRVVLKVLGEVDYGIYNVVGGIVIMLSFLSNTMASASQRFFAFELGQGNYEQLKKTFKMTMTIYVMIAIVILVLAETIGLWFLNTQMTIPPNRIDAANWIYQFSIFSFMMTMFTIPYNAAIIAHERMNVYAWVSIIEVLLKLAIVYLLVKFTFDKLKLYAVLMFSVTTLVTFIYREYCKRKFDECRFSFYWEKGLFKEIMSYSGWNLFGALASVSNNQGINIILNVFFNPLVNAAQAVAHQVNSAINLFVQNFMTATRPQIIKYYAIGENEQMLKLVFLSSKFSFILLFIITLPILLETNFILELWLKVVPEYVVLFVRLVIIIALIDSLSYSLMTAAQATDNIKKYQLIVGGVKLLSLPVSYVFLKLGYLPQSVFYVGIIFSIACLFLRLIILKEMIQFPIGNYFVNVIVRVFLISFISYIIPLLGVYRINDNFYRFIFVVISGVISVVLLTYLVGLSRMEKNKVKSFLHGSFF